MHPDAGHSVQCRRTNGQRSIVIANDHHRAGLGLDERCSRLVKNQPISRIDGEEVVFFNIGPAAQSIKGEVIHFATVPDGIEWDVRSSMQFLVSVIADTQGLATSEEMTAIDAYNDRLQADGHWVFAAGLSEPSHATVIDAREEPPTYTDGPLIKAKEHIAGFWILEASDLDAALALAIAGSKACNRKVEVRPLLGV